MSLAQPFLLLVGLLLPLCGWLFLSRQRRQQQILATLGNLRWTAMLAVAQRGRKWRQSFWLAAVALIVVALARPQWGETVIATPAQSLQLVVVLDVSQSMLAVEGGTERLAEAKQLVHLAATGLQPQDEVALVAFAQTAHAMLPLTTAHDLLSVRVEQLSPDQFSQQGTVLAGALKTAVHTIPLRQYGQPLLLLLTDGEDHGGHVTQTMRQVTDRKMAVVVVGIGSKAGAVVPNRFVNGKPVVSVADLAGLAALAEVENGRFLTADEAFTNLPNILTTIRSEQTEQQLTTQPIEQYQPFLLLAIVLLAIAELSWPLFTIPWRHWSRLAALFLTIWLTGCREAESQHLIANGNEAFAQARYEEAQVAYTAAAELQPASALAQFNLANTLYRLGGYETAVDHWRAILPTMPDPITLDNQFNLGNGYYQLAQWEAAIIAYKEVLKQNPSHQDAKHNLELAWRQLQGEAVAESTTDESRPETPNAKAATTLGEQSPTDFEAGLGEPRLPSGEAPASGGGEPADTGLLAGNELDGHEKGVPSAAAAWLMSISETAETIGGVSETAVFDTLPQSSTKDW